MTYMHAKRCGRIVEGASPRRSLAFAQVVCQSSKHLRQCGAHEMLKCREYFRSAARTSSAAWAVQVEGICKKQHRCLAGIMQPEAMAHLQSTLQCGSL